MARRAQATPRGIGGGVLPALLFLLLAPAVASVPSAAQAPPSPAEVLEHALGERFTDVAEVNRYFEVLAETSERVTLHPYGRSVEGRPLLQVLIASELHHTRIEEILERNRELANPDTPADRAREIVETNPAVIYFSYGVHGNESSSSEAALWTAWDLVRDAPEVDGVLDSALVILDPAVNPDGRDRYVNWYRQARGMEPDPNPDTREHREPWPGGRFNHYLFDLNRDWSWGSQPETRARLATWERWRPQVHVDFHEMSWRSTYFFFPAAQPINPIFPDHTLEWGERFGEGNARAFDERGWIYYTGEDYDLFYPGYGDSWPALLGAIGMTYEQAGGGGAGLVVERPDGTHLTLRDRAQRHRVSGRATLRTAAEGRTDLLLGFARFHREVDEGLPDVVLVPGEDPERAVALVDHLLDQGIRVERAERAFRMTGDPHPGFDEREEFPIGTYRVPMRQSRGRLAGALLQPEFRLDAEFSYDITAWSLPHAYGVEAHTTDQRPDGGWVQVTEVSRGEGDRREGRYGYLLPPGFDSAAGVVRFLEAGGRVNVVADTFSLNGTHYRRGTSFLSRERNPELEELLEEAGLRDRVIPLASGRTDSGPDLGTRSSASLIPPKVALLGGEGTSPTSFGAHWFFLERRLGLDFDVLEMGDVGRIDLAVYDVMVIPGTRNPGSVLGEEGRSRIHRWVEEGGVLIGVADGARDLVAPLAGVEERRERVEEDDLEAGERLDRALRTRAQREAERWMRSMPGTILEATLDPRHPLAFGSGRDGARDRMFVLSSGSVFEPDDSFESVAFFGEAIAGTAGVFSERNRERLERGSWLLQKELGGGKVILFADDPLFRLFWYSGFTPYVNALLLAPAF